MYKYSDKEIEFSLLQEKPIDIAGILMKYISHWKWFLISVIIVFSIAVIYIIYAVPTYKVETSILFKDDTRGGASELNVLKEMGLITRRSNVDNEVEVLKKSLIIEQVVKELNIYTEYVEKRDIKLFDKVGMRNILPKFITTKKNYLYGSESPITIIMGDSIISNIIKTIKVNILAKPNGELIFTGTHLNEKYNIKTSASDTTVLLPYGKIQIVRNAPSDINKERTVDIFISNPLATASQFQKALKIDLTSKTSSVANISLVCSNGNLGKQFLDSYIKAYNQSGIDEQIELADKTSKVIESHLAQLSGELSNVETEAQDYRQSKGLTNIASQADIYSSQSATVRQRLMDIESQITIVSSLNSFVQNLSNHTQMIPSNSGITSPSLVGQIEQYNKLVTERNRLARIASSTNQSMIDLNNRVESTFHTVKNGLQNEKNNLEIQHKDVASMLSQNYARLRAIPQQEREYSDIVRQQNVKEALFVYLLQKKEEKYMNMASVMPNSKLIDTIYIKGIVSPNTQIIFIISLILGLLIPFIVISLQSLLQYNITNKEDLEAISSIPILGEIPISNSTETIAVEESNNNSFNEMMRLLRTNLLFVINGKENKVINMLSSISGEGKTFLTINLAKSLALLDKKIIIVELDIRRPRLSKKLNIKNTPGITLYLAGSLEKEDIIKPSNIHQNISIITCGNIPPNPNELLANPRLDNLIKSLRSEYDYIIIDSAPIGVVSDSLLLNRICDVNIYIVKAKHTHKKYIQDADKYYKEKRLKKVYFILNNVDLSSKSYGYGYRRAYGYY